MKFIRMTACVFTIFFCLHRLSAQNSVGIGTQTPNPNAVLELVSPGNDQGLLVPRLTTQQRIADTFTSRLTDAENGLMVFDIDEGAFYFWVAGQWQSVSNSQSLSAGLGIDIANGVISNTGDLDITNEIQDLGLIGNQLSITNNPEATSIDLSVYLDNTDEQTAQEVAFTPVGTLSATDVQGAIAQLDATLATQPEGDMLKALYDANGDTLVDISAFALDAATVNGLMVETAVPAGALFIDEQIATEVPYDNTQFGLAAVNVQDALDELSDNLNIVISSDQDQDPANEIQDLSLTGDVLTITNNPEAIAIDLSGYMDNTDAQQAIDVPYDNSLTSLTGENVQIAIDELAGLVTADQDQDPANEIQDLSLNGNLLSITNNPASTEVDLSIYLDNTDEQTLQDVYDRGNEINTTAGMPFFIQGDAGIQLSTGSEEDIVLNAATGNANVILNGNNVWLDEFGNFRVNGEVEASSLFVSDVMINNGDSFTVTLSSPTQSTGEASLFIPNLNGTDQTIAVVNDIPTTASQIEVIAQSGISSTNVQNALEELQGEITASGAGDMHTDTYDINMDGWVDVAEAADSLSVDFLDGTTLAYNIGIEKMEVRVNAIDETRLQNGAVTSGKIADGAVTSPKIGISAVSGQVLKFDGTNWNAAADIGLTIPINQTAPTAGNLLTLTNSGTNGPVAQFIISGTTNPQNPLRLETAGTGRAADFRIVNTSSSAEALAVITNGVGNSLFSLNQGTSGSAANLSISNAGNSSPVLNIINSGTGNAISATGTIQATNFSGNASLLTNIPATALSGLLPVNSGGTGAATSGEARNNLGLGTLATLNEITNSNVGIAAAIAGTKINPNFGTQNISTSGSITAASFSGNGAGITNVNATGFSGSLGGDVIGAQGATTIVQVSGQSASDVASATTTTLAATSSNTPSTLVRRNISGDFSGSIITANSFAGDGSAITNLQSSNIMGLGALANVSLITDSEVASGAAIQGSKVNPDFGTQNIVTTGTLSTSNASFSVNASGEISAPTATFSNDLISPSISLVNGTNTAQIQVLSQSSSFAPIQIPDLQGQTRTMAFVETSPLQDDGSNTIAGVLAGSSLSTGVRNILIGRSNGNALTTGSDNTMVGFNAGVSSTAIQNTFIGGSSGASNTTGQDNTYVGYVAGGGNIGGSDNVAIGANSGPGGSTSFLQTVAIGKNAYVNANNTIALGFGAQATATDAIAIGSNVQANTTNTIVLGNNANVGIGINSPNNKLQLNDPNNTDATLQITAGTVTGTSPTDGLLLSVNGAGVSMLNREATPINFGTNTLTRMTITQGGSVGIGTTSPASTLQVAGTVTATAFSGDGAALTNLPITSNWTLNSGNVYRSTGNVGIGTNSPAQRLDVNGNVSIPSNNEYMYAAPKSKIYAVTPGEFNVLRSAGTEDHVLRVTNGILEAFLYSSTQGASGFLAAPLHLPDGAVITEIQVVGRNTSTTTDATFQLIEKSYSTAFNVIPVTSIPQSTSAVSTFTNNALSVTINNNLNNYLLLLNALANQSSITGVRVFYTVSKAD